jgi:Asp-tRNA(Asn)/Glu-tRNA(Gln) amidotransferase A subunit family amidase
VPGAVTLVLPDGVALVGRHGAEADLLAAAAVVRRL